MQETNDEDQRSNQSVEESGVDEKEKEKEKEKLRKQIKRLKNIKKQYRKLGMNW